MKTTIHFYPLYFDAGRVVRVEGYLHEMSHVFAGTDDLKDENHPTIDGPPYLDTVKNAYWIEGLGYSGPKYLFRRFTNNYVKTWKPTLGGK